MNLSGHEDRRTLQRYLKPSKEGTHRRLDRCAQLAVLEDILAVVRSRTTTTVAAVCGSAGVGKTALVVHWAHGVADGFPDGQLYVNLRGYDVDPPVTPATGHAALEALRRRGPRF